MKLTRIALIISATAGLLLAGCSFSRYKTETEVDIPAPAKTPAVKGQSPAQSESKIPPTEQ
ncbi:MAG: hypothetical protein ACREIF_13025 [Chthoniobacterales bacterium]